MSPRILIVDDEDDTLFVFSRLMDRLDVCVDAVRTHEEAVLAIERCAYRLVITDLRLTGTAGEEGLDILRTAREKDSSTAVILVTGFGSPGAMTKAYELGAAYYFEKPVRPAQLLQAAEVLCR